MRGLSIVAILFLACSSTTSKEYFERDSGLPDAGVGGSSGSAGTGSGGMTGAGGSAGSGGLDASAGTGGTGGVVGTGGTGGADGTGGTGGTVGSGGSAGAESGGTGGASGASGGSAGASGGSAGASGGSAGASGGSAGASGCVMGRPGPSLVMVPTAPNGHYCMDATEVTNENYEAFLAASPPTSGQLFECEWNTTYTPTSGWPATGLPNNPVTYVDWCDAYAYCNWAGKRLCGKIGGGPNAYGDFANATLSQWHSACSASATRTYPYGSNYQAAACNVSDNGATTTVPVGSKPGCEGGYPGLFDLSGNVWEWENSCNAAAGDQDSCRVRGGSFWLDFATDLTCGHSAFGYRGTMNDRIGFRCCAD